MDGGLEASPYNPQPADTKAKSYITCTGIEEAADGIKTFYFGSPRDSSGHPFPIQYTPGQYASFDVQVHPAQLLPHLASTSLCRNWSKLYDCLHMMPLPSLLLSLTVHS